MTGPRRARFPAALPATGTAGRSGGPGLIRPQRPLHEAARDAQRREVPRGLGLDSTAVRQRMVERLRREEGIRDEAVLAALAAVERHRFVDSALATQAYEDTSLPIGLEQTISKPSVVARMLELLMQSPGARERGHLGRALEIGTGCGYQTAVLARLARSVVSIERLRPLYDKAREHLAPLQLRSVRLVHGDGMLGHGPNAPYDSIIAAAGGDDVPAAWLEQLAVGGRLVAPMRRAGSGAQVLVAIDRHNGGLTRAEYESVHFVPLKSGVL